jgi:hypothetical protein
MMAAGSRNTWKYSRKQDPCNLATRKANLKIPCAGKAIESGEGTAMHKYVLFKNSIRASKKTLHSSITETKLLIFFTEIIAVYSENHVNPVKTLCEQNAKLLNFRAGGRYS